ncbi:MAG: chromate transporter [Selenomonadales bacterium]|jgi:chromate transporter|nr:chromate transporter [Selenomonadales bacterium]
MILIQLLVSFFTVGFFSYGGGYAMIPLIEREIVQRQAWLTPSEFLDILAVAEITPGPVAINSATFVGYRVAGILGSIMATFGVVLPSLLVILALSYLYVKYQGAPALKAAFAMVRPIVVVLILMAAVNIGFLTIKDARSAVLAIAVLVLMHKTRLNPILLLVLSGVVGVFIF